jgi:site-specific recombinase XerD
VEGHPTAPSSVFNRFLTERSSHLSPSTISFYRKKLSPFVIWCEGNQIVDVRQVNRSHVAAFLSAIREGRRNNRPLNNGALKLHHQCLKTLFNYVRDTCTVDNSWVNPVIGLRVKASQSQTLEYSQVEIARLFEIIDSLEDRFQRTRNRAIITVLSGQRN